MANIIRHRIELLLFRQGFTSVAVRNLLFIQIIIFCVGLVLGIFCAWLTLWPIAFAAGACISTCNFWFIAKFAQKIIPSMYSKGITATYFLFFVLRLALAAVVLFLVLVVAKAPVLPLSVGLISPLMAILMWGFFHIFSKPAKEV